MTLKEQLEAEALEHASRNNVSWAERELKNCIQDFKVGALNSCVVKMLEEALVRKDHPRWCECAACKALAELKKLRGEI